MSRSFFSCLVFLFLVMLSVPAHAQMTAVELQTLCASRYDVDAGMCAGYVQAIAEELMADSDPRARTCLSPAIAAQTLVDNVRRGWAARAPQPQDFAADSVAGVLKDRFRCP